MYKESILLNFCYLEQCLLFICPLWKCGTVLRPLCLSVTLLFPHYLVSAQENEESELDLFFFNTDSH